jgi:hypothetical protein
MVLSLTLPEPGKQKRIKDMIIDILSFEWPLTLTSIYNKVSKDYAHSSTCQATYKAICELLKDGVLVKQDKFYSLNMQWIDKIKEFSKQIEKNYNENEKVPLIDGILKVKTENNVSVLTFNSLLELDKAWIDIKKNYYRNLDKREDVTFWKGSHCWWLLVYPESEFDILEILKKKKVKDFAIIHNSSAMDKLAKKFYDKSGITCKIKNEKIDSDMTVFGDTIMQVSLPEKLRKDLHRIYEKCQKPEEVDIHDLLKNVLTKKNQINLVLTKNKDIADQLKQTVMKEFNY